MANNVHQTTESGISALVTGITDDVQQLIRQEMSLIRQEIQENIHKAKEGVTAFALGAAVAGVSAILIGFTAVYVLAAISSLPLWGSFAITTSVFVIATAVLFFMGKKKLDSIRPVHDPANASLRHP
jgi:protein-S-isoprenylcysteine O-methyltransferase Ste14